VRTRCDRAFYKIVFSPHAKAIDHEEVDAGKAATLRLRQRRAVMIGGAAGIR
jgi:hypothetical protein